MARSTLRRAHAPVARGREDPRRPRLASNTYTQGEVPRGEPLAHRFADIDPWFYRPAGRCEHFQQTHREICLRVMAVYEVAEQTFAGGQGAPRLLKLRTREMVDRIVPRIIDALVEDRTLLVALTGTGADVDYLPRHTVNVAFLSARMGAALGYNERQVERLTATALLQDLGMTEIPDTVREKRGPLTSREHLTVGRHPTTGADLLSHHTLVDRPALHAMSQVHERLDGSGYPGGKRDVLIHNYARIIAVADTYDALRWDRPWRTAHLPYEAMVITLKEVGARRLDPVAARALVECLGLFPVGSLVRLDDGRLARVIDASGADYGRPVLRVFNQNGTFDRDPWVLDLADPAHVSVSVERPLPAGSFPYHVPPLGGY